MSWESEAKSKGLPQQFIAALEASDAVTEQEKQRIVASVSTAAELKAKRDAAVDYGRRLGEQTADDLGETGMDKEQRMRRAMAYAAWEFDGKPPSSQVQRAEFGVGELATDLSWMRRPLQPKA
jgi:hypothetical protein